MSAIKELIIDYEEEFEKSILDFTAEDWFKIQMENVKPSNTPIPEIEKFFYDIMPQHRHFSYWLMVKEGNCKFHRKCNNLTEFTKYISAFIQQEKDLFFIPSQFQGWRVDDNAIFTNVLYADIDGIEEDTLKMDKSELSNWLMDKYDLSVSQLPNYILCSGHGLHLYYLIDEINMQDFSGGLIRDRYIDYLMYFFHSDPACRNRSHIMRVPLSYNRKEEYKIKTKLHFINSDNNYDIHRLDFMICDYSNIEKYIQEGNSLRAKKASETRAKNKVSKSAPSKSPQKANALSSEIKKLKEIVHMDYRNDYQSKARVWNVVIDLHNYFCRHDCNIIGHRHQFAHILTVLLYKCAYSADEIKKFVLPYFTSDFVEEAEATIERTLKRKYSYKNSTIAIMLGFTLQDYEKSYCCYTEEQKQQRRKKTNAKSYKKYYEKQKAERQPTPRQIAAQKNYEYVKAHPEKTQKDLSAYLGVSVDTIKRIRKRIKNES